MNPPLDARDDAPAFEYGPLGLNHTLRIAGRSYFYDPNIGLWERGSGPRGTEDMPSTLNAESIHDWMRDGVHVLPWTPIEEGVTGVTGTFVDALCSEPKDINKTPRHTRHTPSEMDR